MASPIAEAVLLGVLQGVTEFLPISSSGHLALAQMLFGVRDASLTLSVVLHGGTLLATALVLRRRIGQIAVAMVEAIKNPRQLATTDPGRDALFVIVASVPTAIIGLSVRDLVAAWTGSPVVVAIGFFVTAGLLISVRFAPLGTVERPSLLVAFLFGVVQGAAVVPGISRSGSTIAAGLWTGVRPDRAFELSMLMSLPAVVGALAVEISHAVGSGENGLALVAGAAVAFAVGIVALRLLRHSVTKGYFAHYALWVVPLAVATLALGMAWPS